MLLIIRIFYRILFVWVAVAGWSCTFVGQFLPVHTLAQSVVNPEDETDHSVGYLSSQFLPFHQNGSRAVVVENFVVAAPDFKSFRLKLTDSALLRNSLHGRLCFPVISGVSIDLRNTCYRFLDESWLQYNCFRC